MVQISCSSVNHDVLTPLMVQISCSSVNHHVLTPLMVQISVRNPCQF
jgi:hypothetical protein